MALASFLLLTFFFHFLLVRHGRMKVGESKRLFLWTVCWNLLTWHFVCCDVANSLPSCSHGDIDSRNHTSSPEKKKAGENERRMILETNLWCVLRVNTMKSLEWKFFFISPIYCNLVCNDWFYIQRAVVLTLLSFLGPEPPSTVVMRTLSGFSIEISPGPSSRAFYRNWKEIGIN